MAVNPCSAFNTVLLLCILGYVHGDELSYVDHIMNHGVVHEKHIQAQKSLAPFLQSDQFTKWKSQLSRDEMLRRATVAASNQTLLANHLQSVFKDGNIQNIIENITPMLTNLAKTKQGSALLQSVLQGVLKSGNTQELQELAPLLSSLNNPQNLQAVLQTLAKNGNLQKILSSLPRTLKGSLQSALKTTDPNQLMKTFGPLLANLTSGQGSKSISGLISQNLNADTITKYALNYIETMLDSIKTTAQCKSDVINVINGLANRQPWALNMLDASAKIPSDVLDFNLHWYGSYDECYSESMFQKYNIIPTNNSIPSVESKYCTANVNAPLPPAAMTFLYLFAGGALKLGICVPKSCSEYELKTMTTALLGSIPLGDQKLYATSVSCPTTQRPWKASDIAMIVLCGFFLTLMILGTAYDLLVIEWPKYQKQKKDQDDISLENDMGSKYQLRANNMELPVKSVNGPEVVTTDEQNIVGKILLAFSVYTNGRKLLSTAQPKGSLTAVNGIRFLSMTWVILGHTLAFVNGTASNYGPYAVNFIKKRSNQAIFNALVSVDSFFVLSGLLTSYLVLQQMNKSKGKINWFLFYFHRYWRLTPVYMIMIGLYVCIYPHFVYGPNQPDRDTACPNAWYTNLFYVNNFVAEMKNLCMGWSWYLNNDMQFYVLSPLMILPLFFKDIIGLVVCSVFLLATTITTGVLSYEKHLPPHTAGGGTHPEANGKYFQDYYIKPYCRMGPYIIGIVTGYILYKIKCKCRINIFVNLAGWGVATACASAVLYGLYDAFNGNPLSDEVSALYNALNRTVWGASLSWVIFACATGNGGPVNTLLSWGAFVPLSRLTYCAYLVHPIVMYITYYGHREPFYLSDYYFVYLFLGHLCIAYGCALVISLAFEAPFMQLEKVIFKSHGSKRS